MSSTPPHTGEKSPGSDPTNRAEAHAPYAKKTRGYMQVLSLTSVGLEMGISVVIGLFAGQWADRRWGTEPLFLLLGVLLGCAAAGRAVWAAVKKADRMVDPVDPPSGSPPSGPSSGAPTGAP